MLARGISKKRLIWGVTIAAVGISLFSSNVLPFSPNNLLILSAVSAVTYVITEDIFVAKH